MKVILAEHYGFCYGVKRAVKMAKNSAGETPSFTLGPIIHNPQMVDRLAQQGIGMVDSLGEIQAGENAIVRSHGVGPEVYERAEKIGVHIVDATCPHVKKAQLAAHALCVEGRQVVIIGEKCHPEVKSIFEWSGKEAFIVETPEEARLLNLAKSLGIVVQTTFSRNEFKKIVYELLDKSNDLRIMRTICTATEQRQNAAIKLAEEADCMIVIGGRNSANTTRLAELCAAVNPKTHHIETAIELEKEWFIGVTKVGMTAGASTPDFIIEEVHKKVESMEELLNESLDGIKVDVGDTVKGTVVGVFNKEVYVDIGYKAEGLIPLAELAYPVPENAKDVVKVGDELDVYVLSVEGEKGLLLSKRRADTVVVWERIETLAENKETIQAKVTEVVKGGIVVSVSGIRGFVPASQVDLRFVEDLSVYVGQELTLEILETDRRKNRIVLSRRAVLERLRKEREVEVFAALEVGQQLTGTVKRLADFGAFVDIGGVDGLVHISDLSWERVKRPSDVVNVGDEVSVIVKKFDPDTKRISLSIKEVTRDPWLDKADALSVDSSVNGTVVKLMDFGVFVKLENGLDGLVRMAELADKRIAKAEEVVQVGDPVCVKILQIDKQNKKIALSCKQAQLDFERAEYQEYVEEQTDEVNSSTLGDQFGHMFQSKED